MPRSYSLILAGGSSGATACGAAAAEGACVTAVCGFFVATGFLATALRFFFASFLPADFNFRVRMAFFVVALRFVDMDIPLVTGITWHRSYNAYLRGGQTIGRVKRKPLRLDVAVAARQ